MELIRWNPAKDIFGLGSRMQHVFNDFFCPTLKDAEAHSLWNWSPVADIYDHEDAIVIKAELPGVDKKDISVDVQGRFLMIKGERSSDKEVKEDNYHRRERSYGKFERTFTLPLEVDAGAINAEYKDGVLNIVIPKPAEHKPKKITVH